MAMSWRADSTSHSSVPNPPSHVTVHGSRVTSVQEDSEPRTGRGRGFALEWPKVGGRSHREAGGGLQAALSGTDFKGNSRHNSGEGTLGAAQQVKALVDRYGAETVKGLADPFGQEGHG